MTGLAVYWSSHQNAAIRSFMVQHQTCRDQSPRSETLLEATDQIVWCECPVCRSGAGFSRLGEKIMEWSDVPSAVI